jgi:hypothetical protein
MIYELAAEHGLNEQRSAEILDRKHRIYEYLEHNAVSGFRGYRICALGKIPLSTRPGYIRNQPQSEDSTDVASDRNDVRGGR